MIESNARVGFVGAGKVGTALGELFRSCGIAVSGYSSLLAEDARAAAEKTASDAYADAAEVVEASDGARWRDFQRLEEPCGVVW